MRIAIFALILLATPALAQQPTPEQLQLQALAHVTDVSNSIWALSNRVRQLEQEKAQLIGQLKSVSDELATARQELVAKPK